MSDHETPVLHEQPDAWHRHSADEGAPQVEHGSHASPTALAITFVAMVLGVAVVVLVLVAYFNGYVTKVKAEKNEGVSSAAEFESYRAASLTRLREYGWADPAADTVHIPVDAAMDLVVEKYAALNQTGANATEVATTDAP